MPEEMFKVAPLSASDISKVKSAIARQIAPIILEAKKGIVQQAVDDIVESEGQSVDNDYSTRFEINDREATGIITISLGSISGPFDTVVQGHTRSTKNDKAKVSSHTRHYEGERPFQLPNGSWVTSNQIPAELAEDAARKALGE